MGLDMYLAEQLYYGGQWRDSDWHEEGHTLIVKGGFAEKHDNKKSSSMEQSKLYTWVVYKELC